MDFPSRPSSSRPRRESRADRASDDTGEWRALSIHTEAEPAVPEDDEEAPFGRDASRDLPDDDGRRAPGDRDERPTPARMRRSARNETLSRFLWAVPWLLFAVIVIVLGGAVFAVAMTGLAWVILGEFFRMTQRAQPFQLVAYAAAAGMILAAYFGDSFQILLIGMAFFPVMLAFAMARSSLTNVTWAMAVTVFGIIWIGLPLAHAVLLRDLPLHGAALLVDVLVATFFTDTFAYAGGRMFGQRPLASMVSPNKTVEGLMIGIAGGVLGFWLAGLYQDWLSGPEALLMGLCIALIAPLGDLFESAIKRDLDIKDSGRMLGPHGGLLDRLGAVLFTVVAGYYLSVAIVY